jgi:hypothetical protein
MVTGFDLNKWLREGIIFKRDSTTYIIAMPAAYQKKRGI